MGDREGKGEYSREGSGNMGRDIRGFGGPKNISWAVTGYFKEWAVCDFRVEVIPCRRRRRPHGLRYSGVASQRTKTPASASRHIRLLLSRSVAAPRHRSVPRCQATRRAGRRNRDHRPIFVRDAHAPEARSPEPNCQERNELRQKRSPACPREHPGLLLLLRRARIVSYRA